jgi:hypothetical protein
MFGRWKRKQRHHADRQQGDPAALEREGDPRGGLQSPEYRNAEPTAIVENDDRVAMAGPGGAPADERSPEERRAADR